MSAVRKLLRGSGLFNAGRLKFAWVNRACSRREPKTKTGLFPLVKVSLNWRSGNQPARASLSWASAIWRPERVIRMSGLSLRALSHAADSVNVSGSPACDGGMQKACSTTCKQKKMKKKKSVRWMKR